MIQLPDRRWVRSGNLAMTASAQELARLTEQMCAVIPQIDAAKRRLAGQDEADRP